MSPQGQILYDLLPALYKLRDAGLAPITPAENVEMQQLLGQGTLNSTQQLRLSVLQAQARGPLQSLLMLIDEQLAILADDLDQLYDDQFIETCAPWVIPYIGELIGYQPVHGVAAAIASPRAEVAQTISFRRRKGTILVLEQLARDVTGWGAHATEQFQLLATTQSMKHLRPDNHYSPNLRRWQPGEYIDTGFDKTAHTVDVRRIAIGRGRYNLQNIAVFLWSLNAYPLTRATAATAGTASATSAQCFRCNPLGADVPLFNNPIPQGSTITTAAQPQNVAGRLTRRVLCEDNQSGSGGVYYGEGNSLALYLSGTLLNSYQVQVCDLSGADGSWMNLPTTSSTFSAAIDPELGRVALPPPTAGAAEPTLQVSFCQGFNADTGGGQYPRSDTFVVQQGSSVLPFPDTASPARYASLQDALNFAVSSFAGTGEIAVEISDSATYTPITTAQPSLVVNVPAGTTIELRAADGHRPTILLAAEMTVLGGANSTFQVNGLVIGYFAASGSPVPAALIHAHNDGTSAIANLNISHCTLVPGLSLLPTGAAQYAGKASLLAELPGLQVNIVRSIVGGLQIAPLAAATITDSIVDAAAPACVAYAAPDGASGGGSLTLTGSTVIGKLHAGLVTLVSNSIVLGRLTAKDTWPAPFWADRKQQGCVRFSYLPVGSITPRQYAVLEPVNGVLTPVFYSLRYGSPGYAKLQPATCDTIRRGADDGGEMGAFHFLLAPMRETDLRVRLQEYLPAGLECGLYFEA
jgi:hypothetical protein